MFCIDSRTLEGWSIPRPLVPEDAWHQIPRSGYLVLQRKLCCNGLSQELLEEIVLQWIELGTLGVQS
jgi:hypothetical protein